MLHKTLLGDQVKEDDMGRECTVHGRDEKGIQNFSQKPEGT